MVAANKSPQEIPNNRQTRSDNLTARMVRFAVGSIFGLVFIGFCFVMLTVALKGPDTIKVDKATGSPGLVGPAAKERLKVGDPAPDFLLAQLGGDPVELSKLRGKTVLINFWATWCAPCKEEMPILQQFYLKYRNDNVVVLAVNVRDSAEAAKGYFKDNNLTMPVLLDYSGEVPGGYRVTGYPESYIVDKNGNIGEFNIGPFTDIKDLETKLQLTWHSGGK
jgi:thiol-disulfide isomerase/thioredoxin